MAIRSIYFDCMDTLIQMRIPSIEVYSLWAYQGAADLGLWNDAGSFRSEWNLHRDRSQARSGDLREGTILGRIRDLLAARLAVLEKGWAPERIDGAAERIHEKWWAIYRSAAYVLPEVPEVLARIHDGRKIPLGVVSNFMVKGGIQTLLADHGLDRFFRTVVVSCDNGYRKPSRNIFREALEAAGVPPGEILFIGDSPAADYQGPRAVGMRSLLYDPLDAHSGIEDRVKSFREIEAWLDLSSSTSEAPRAS